ncbi:MAG: hypothetical protein ACR2F1_12605 [Nitrososphaeraceae archaeon]
MIKSSIFKLFIYLIIPRKTELYFGNSNCGALIQFEIDIRRPIVCQMCGEGIDWEGEYTKRIKLCPQCNEE